MSTTVDLELLNPFMVATSAALRTMAQVQPVRTKIHTERKSVLMGDVSGIMGLSGDVAGSIALCFQARTACRVVGKMLGEEFASVTPAVVDGIAEIVNLVAGQAKNELAGTNYKFKVSIPTTVIGQGHEIYHQKGVPCVIAEFEVDGDPFLLEISLAPTKKS